MLFDEWMVLFHLSANDKGQNQDITKRRDALKNVFKTNIDSKNDYQSLFALQTSYAIIVKLIACKVITKFHFDKNVELANKFLLRGLPTTVFINKKGEEFARIIGFVNFDDKKIIKWLQKYD